MGKVFPALDKSVKLCLSAVLAVNAVVNALYQCFIIYIVLYRPITDTVMCLLRFTAVDVERRAPLRTLKCFSVLLLSAVDRVTVCELTIRLLAVSL